MIGLYSKNEIQIMQEGGKILAKILSEVVKKVKPGITTKYLDKVASDLILKYKAKPSFKGFNNYPAVLCTSINEEIVHALPSKRVLKNGDILSLDLGIRRNGYCVDAAITIPIGKIDKKIMKMVEVTKRALKKGINQAKTGNRLGDIGWAIENYVKKNGFNVVRELCGHGIGKKVHEDPLVLNYKEGNQDVKLKEGMVLALEPMVVMGDWRVEKTKDGFGYKTLDGSFSAHFEHTIAITKKGPVVLTKI